MISLRLRLDRKDLKRLDRLSGEARFAAARALTSTAQDAQGAVRDSLSDNFTLRNNYVSRGIRIEKATKRNLEAKVGSVDDFMALHETGGVKRARDGGSLAIPTKKVRRTKRGKISKANRPRRLLDKPNVFRFEGDGDSEWIARRRGKSSKAPLTFLYVLARKAEIDPKLGLRETTEDVVGRRFPGHFESFMRQYVDRR